MKHIVLVTLLVAGGVILSGCGSNTGTSPTDATSPTDTADVAVVPELPAQEEVLPQQEEKKEIALDGSSVEVSMKDLMKQGKPATCTFSQSTEDGTTLDGILSVDGAKLSSVTKGRVGGQTITMNMILDDGYVHTRTNLQPGKGYKTKENTDTQVNTDGETAGEMEKNMTFTCTKGVKEGVFDLPSDVTFEELTY